MYKASEIASFYIQLFNSIPENSIDNLKLNKMLYYAQAWSLARSGHPLFDDEIQAWDYGPVIPEVYHKYKCCGKNPIEEPAEQFDETCLSSDELDLLIDVYRGYGCYTGLALKDMTHRKGAPWYQVYIKNQSNPIPIDIIKAYFDGKTLDTFEADRLNIPEITAVPITWDSSEDEIYG